MVFGSTLRLTLAKAVITAAAALTGPFGIASQIPSANEHFVIAPRGPEIPVDPSTFDLNEPVMPIGGDPGLRMTMPVRIGERGPYPFMIDTGSQRTIIATELATRLMLPPLQPVEIISMAGRVTVSSVQLSDLRFGDHAVSSLAALTIARADMGSLGIIGLDSLADKRLILDFNQRRMEVSRSRRSSAVRDEKDAIVVRARSRYGQLILMNSRVDGRKVDVILDTGAEQSVGNMALFRSLKAKRLVVPPTPTVLTSVTGVDVPAQFAVVRQLTIGDATLDNVPMLFLDAAPFTELGLGERPAMLLGMGMLRLFDRIAIDFGQRHVDFHLAGGDARQRGRLDFADTGAADASGR
ncbi:putative aspartyl protease [Sphingobium sp. B1D7B]|uniref:retroviral-like aspartic protease family protein n=1 Tax=unclassified Sphingobium TaxID=2611147 RepID=UPI00222441AA|nr:MULTISPECIES: retroviral-like aspartic protease family protein [unclassified Sphingobium]MCW2391993.1 putative aspartyl protease [Sphingobium sp. B11D3A]MCW2403700.1 putative aspartyl protease [Sphingobium sp. B1D7B]